MKTLSKIHFYNIQLYLKAHRQVFFLMSFPFVLMMVIPCCQDWFLKYEKI